MNVEIGTENPIFLFWEYLFHNFGILSLQKMREMMCHAKQQHEVKSALGILSLKSTRLRTLNPCQLHQCTERICDSACSGGGH
jgi:hypothetical protein